MLDHIAKAERWLALHRYLDASLHINFKFVIKYIIRMYVMIRNISLVDVLEELKIYALLGKV